MVLYIYLGISLLTMILFLLTNVSSIHIAKSKIKNLSDKQNKDKAGLIIAYLKLIIISFIPLVNIFFLFLMLFFGNEISKKANVIIDEAIEKSK
jgi:uncharacterized membrane protein